MLTKRIVLGILAIALIAGIYALPKVVVDNDSDEQVTEQGPPDMPGAQQEAIAKAHSVADAGELRTVINAYKDSLQNNGNSKKSLIFADSLASLYGRLNRPDSAASFIEMLVADSPGVTTWVRAGDAYYEAFGISADAASRSEYASRARGYYEKVLEEDPSNMEVKNRVAMTWLASPNPMQGILTLREIIQDDPGNVQAIFNLGVLSMQSGQYDNAVSRFEQLLAIDPENIEAHFFLGVSYLEIKNPEAARRAFEYVKEHGKDPAVIADAESYLQSI